MLGRSIYEETKRDIQDHANRFTKELADQLARESAMQRAIIRANRVARSYHRELRSTLFSRLNEIGTNAVEYYAPDLTAAERAAEVTFAMNQITRNKYYGLTLPQRIRQSHIQLKNNIRKSSSVGTKFDTRLQNITRVFNETYPFGAQKNWDTRLFLAEAVRLEHIVAKDLAVRKAVKLVRWTLSKSHTAVDMCDQLATAVDSNVDDFVKKNRYDLDTHGVYFIRDIPKIPHPNCQCVLKYIYKTKTRIVRKPKKQPNLIQRILRAIFK